MPIAGPHIGAILGASIYLLLIEFHWEQEDDSEQKINVDRSQAEGKGDEQGVDNDALGESSAHL